ncbi:hypothetical protein F2Q69_00005991 [Brassica cretica]|uniref:Uncharacterized protein n=1 Tax=Brassica cretica TaxID=69181 RepID=A0A8S9P7N4_BRACR|nr:hypothetical protein F2Q69_00005991 [Brassica cretica]
MTSRKRCEWLTQGEAGSGLDVKGHRETLRVAHSCWGREQLERGQRSTVALPERTKAHRECRPGAKSKHSAPYASGTKVIGKADGEAHQHPGTSMFQKGRPQNHRVPSEPVPPTMGVSILESGCRFFRRSFSSRYTIMDHISKKSRLSLQCESKIKNSYFRAGQQITYSRFQLIQVIFTSQTYESCHPSTCKARILNLPRPRKNPEKETSERRYVHAKPKGPATDKPVLMPTEASSVSPSGLAPTR